MVRNFGMIQNSTSHFKIQKYKMYAALYYQSPFGLLFVLMLHVHVIDGSSGEVMSARLNTVRGMAKNHAMRRARGGMAAAGKSLPARLSARGKLVLNCVVSIIYIMSMSYCCLLYAT